MRANLPLWGSIRGRFLATAALLALVLLGVALYSQRLFIETQQASRRIEADHDALRRRVEALKPPLRQAESLLYQHAIRPSAELRIRALERLEQLCAYADALVEEIPDPVDSGHGLGALAEEFRRDMHRLKGRGDEFLRVGSDIYSRYPAMALLTGTLVPLNEEFAGALDLAIEEGRGLAAEDPGHAEPIRLLRDLRYYWLQQTGAFRVFVANRSGVFGEPGRASDRAMRNRAVYADQVAATLARLEDLRAEGVLGFQQSDSLDILTRVRAAREKAAAEAAAIYSSDRWRADLPLLQDRVAPIVETGWRILSRFEDLLDRQAGDNAAEVHRLSATLSRFIWLFLGFLYLAIVIAYVVFETVIRRPLLTVARAMEAEAEQGNVVPLAPTRIEETDTLIDAFQLMQQQVRSRQQRIEAILVNAGEGIVTIDTLGRIESFNPAAERIFGRRVDDVVGRNVSLLMPEPDRSVHDEYMRAYQEGGEARILGRNREVVGCRADGGEVPLSLSVSEMRVDGKPRYIGVLHDITERKQAESQLRRAKAVAEAAGRELEGKNRALTASLERLQQTQRQLVEAEKMASLGGLVAGVAHEINTPVGIGVTAASHLDHRVRDLAVGFEAGQLKRSDLGRFVREAREGAGIILANLQRAAELVKSFKQVAVDQTHDELREVSLCTYLREVLLSLWPRLKKSPHRVVVECGGIRIEADGERDGLSASSAVTGRAVRVETFPGALSQVLTNLLINSLEHAYEPGQAGCLRIRVVESPGQLRLDYRDDGKGIPEEARSHIFEPFYTTRRGQGGSGLGLHVVYNLVTQQLGGAIHCDSAPGEGTEFRIELPIRVRPGGPDRLA